MHKKHKRQVREKSMTDVSPDLTKERQQIYGKQTNAKSGSATTINKYIENKCTQTKEKRSNEKCAKNEKKKTAQNKNSLSAQKI